MEPTWPNENSTAISWKLITERWTPTTRPLEVELYLKNLSIQVYGLAQQVEQYGRRVEDNARGTGELVLGVPRGGFKGRDILVRRRSLWR